MCGCTCTPALAALALAEDGLSSVVIRFLEVRGVLGWEGRRKHPSLLQQVTAQLLLVVGWGTP